MTNIKQPQKENMNIDKEIKEFLSEKLVEKVTMLARYYFVEYSGNKEAKEMADANIFMESLLTGKGFVKKEATFVEKHAELYKKIIAYSNKIKELEKDSK